MNSIYWEETVPGGAAWSHILKRGTALRLTDREGSANVGMMLYNAANLTERFNMPDTLKAQHTAKITRGNVLMSDMGRAMVSVVADTCGWHDPLAGTSNEALVIARYGDLRYQQHRNACLRSGLELFLTEIGKHGLGWRDLMPNMNWFSRVSAAADGSLSLVPNNSAPGSCVELRAELDTLIVLNTAPHPLDSSTPYAPKPVHLTIGPTNPPAADDYCRNFRPENARSLTLSERYFL